MTEPAALTALQMDPEIPGLTEGIGAGDERAWKAALARLGQARLVAPPEGRDPAGRGALDTHPLVREYFGERGAMRLFEADADLEWTRLHLGPHPGAGDRTAARRHLERARELVRACGYGRREREVRWLEERVAGAS